MEEFLVRRVERDDPELTEEALEVLAQDFPVTLAANAVRWTRRRRSYTFKLQILRVYISRGLCDPRGRAHPGGHRGAPGAPAARSGALQALRTLASPAATWAGRSILEEEKDPSVLELQREIFGA